MNTCTDGFELRSLRKELGLSQAKLADLTGLVQAKISSYELGKNGLKAEELLLIDNTIHRLNKSTVNKLKVKRYRSHEYSGATLSARPRRGYSITQGNANYLAKLHQLEKKALTEPRKKSPKALSIFVGCGGLCYGAQAAGFQIVGVSEIHEGFRKIYSLNFPSTPHLTHDVRLFTNEACNELIMKEGKIDLMLGGPPCQGFSLTGKRDANDARNTLFSDYLRIANIIRPKVILMENVRLLTSMKDPNGHLVSERILSEFSRIGYLSDFFCINATNYGVPQHRERVFFIAVNKNLGIAPSIPPSSHGRTGDLFGSMEPYLTFGDAVSDLEYFESGEKSKTDKLHAAVTHPEHVIKWLVDVPEGCSAHENDDPDMRPPSGYNTTYKRQIWNEPGGTVSTTFTMISGCRNVHPIATRSLTIREALRLQSFPDSYRFEGTAGDIRTSIGNAVPPLLSYAFCEHIMKSYIL